MKLEATRILKKMDGFAVLLALVLSHAFSNLTSIVFDLSQRLVSSPNDSFSIGYGAGWQDMYLIPVASCVLWLLGVELVLQATKYFRSQTKNK